MLPFKFNLTKYNPLLVTHAGCLDGAGCVVAFKLAGGKDVVTVPPNGTKRIMNDLKKHDDGRLIFFADVAPISDEEIEFYSKRVGFLVMDHHKTAAVLDGRPCCIIDQTKCGSMIIHEMLKKNGSYDHLDVKTIAGLDFLTLMIDDHDRWQCTSQLSDDLALFMKVVGFSKFVDRFVTNLELKWSPEELYAIESYKDRRIGYVQKMLKRVKVREVDGKRVAYVIADEHVSYLLHQVLTVDSTVDIAAAIDFSNNVVSLRSGDPKNDCSAFAQQRGGGGHACSSAYKIRTDVIDDLIEEVGR